LWMLIPLSMLLFPVRPILQPLQGTESIVARICVPQ